MNNHVFMDKALKTQNEW